MFVEQIDKGEVKLLTLIAENFIKNGDFENAIQIYRKNGDFKRLASTYIQNGQWDEVEFFRLIQSSLLILRIFF